MIEKMGDVVERIRLVVLGGPKVGKSAIIKRFLFNTFQEKYRSTVEELYSKEYRIGRITLKVDILDTAGDLQFPAMRRLSIATAHAFLLVYTVDDPVSFDNVKACFHEIQEQRSDSMEIPIVVAGNKSDVDPNSVEVEFDDVSDWITDHMTQLKTKVLECSAKQNGNVKEVFHAFIELSKILVRMQEQEKKDAEVEDGANITRVHGLRRRLSAHGWSRSSQKTSPKSRSHCSTPTKEPSTPVSPRSHFSFFTPPRTPPSPSNLSPNYLTAEDTNSHFERNKPRSRSLIRRCSKKVKKQVQDASEAPGECQIA